MIIGLKEQSGIVKNQERVLNQKHILNKEQNAHPYRCIRLDCKRLINVYCLEVWNIIHKYIICNIPFISSWYTEG